MKKTTIFGSLALMIVAMVVSSGLVNAYRGDTNTNGPYHDEDTHTAIEEAMSNYDYETWAYLMSQNERGSRVLEGVNADNFATFVDAHNAASRGDFAKSNELRTSIGLNNGQGSHDGKGFKQIMRGANKIGEPKEECVKRFRGRN